MGRKGNPKKKEITEEDVKEEIKEVTKEILSEVTPDSTIQPKIKSIFSSLDKADSIPSDFWKLSLSDFYCFSVMFATTISVWLVVSFTSTFQNIINYWDGPNYLYAAATLYKIPNNNPWTTALNYPPSYFACHLPGYPLLIRLCSYLLLKNYTGGFYLSIIVSGFLLCYSFRRLLVITNVVRDPTYSTILLSFLPVRLVIYHSVGASESLFMTFVSLSFIFYKMDNFWLMLLAVWGGCITRIEGMAIGGTIGLCYLLRFRIVKAFGMFLTFLAPLFLSLFHYYRFNDYLAYIHFNQGSQQLIRFPPFQELIQSRWNSSNIYVQSFVGFFILLIFGTFLVFSKSILLGIFSTAFILYVSLLFHIDIYRYAIPASIFSYIVGFDGFLSSKKGKVTLAIVFPIYAIGTLIYCKGQISSNIAWPQFMNEIFYQIKRL